MSFCLNQSRIFLSLTALALSSGAHAGSLVEQTGIAPKVRSVIRTDARGRLVRTFVVTQRAVRSNGPDGRLAPGGNIPALVEAAARKYEVDPLLVHSVIQVESNYNPYAVSSKGAQGLMQLMPGTARRFGVANAFDPADNIEGGVRYLKYLSDLFPNDTRLALAAYNAGEGAVWKYNYRIPPYRETIDYVYKVAKKYGEARNRAERSGAAEEPASTVETTAPESPAYAPVQYAVDSDGRLHLSTGP